MFGLDKTLTAIIGCLAAAAVLALLVFGGLYLGERRERQRAESQTRVAVGSQNAGKGAVEALEGQIEAKEKLGAQERVNQTNIRGAENAGTHTGATGNAGRVALCANPGMRRDHPDYCRD